MCTSFFALSIYFCTCKLVGVFMTVDILQDTICCITYSIFESCVVDHSKISKERVFCEFSQGNTYRSLNNILKFYFFKRGGLGWPVPLLALILNDQVLLNYFVNYSIFMIDEYTTSVL